jgi:hypothetical protein
MLERAAEPLPTSEMKKQIRRSTTTAFLEFHLTLLFAFDLQNDLLLRIGRAILPRFLFAAIAKGQSQQE